MVPDVLVVHILFSEIAALILKNLTVHRKYLREKADFDLFLQFIDRVAINEDALSGRMGMEVQKTEKFVLLVVVHDYFPDGIDGRVLFGRRVDVAPV